MSASRQSLTNTLFLSEEKLLQLVVYLRENDFTIGSDQVVDLYDIFLSYSTQNRLPAELINYASLIAPIVCQNESDQQRFQLLWRTWLGQQGYSFESPAISALGNKQTPSKLNDKRGDINRQTPFWPYLLLGLFLSYIGWYSATHVSECFSAPQVSACFAGIETISIKSEPDAKLFQVPQPFDLAVNKPAAKVKSETKIKSLISVERTIETQIQGSIRPGEKLLDISPNRLFLLMGNKNGIRLRSRASGEVRNLSGTQV